MNEKVLKILFEIRPECDFNKSVNFVEDGMLDSFDIISLVTSLDEELGISIEGTDILPENFSNLEVIIQLLNKYL